MLDTALKFQRVLGGINVPESSNENEKPPNSDDWKNVERLVWFLKGFYLLTHRISGSYYATSNKGLFEIAAIYDMLNEWEKSVDLNFQSMAISMKKKFDKYWGIIEKMNLFIYVVVVLDPHSKMLAVELSLTDMYGKEKGMQLANNVKDYAHGLFDEYRAMYSSQVPQAPPSGESMSMDLDDNGNISGGIDYMRSVKDMAKRMKGSSGYVDNEFDRYINEQLGAKEEDMDPLAWWGCNGHRYPVVSRMARDILAIHLSTLASKLAFSARGRCLDPFRSSLTPKMVQDIICTQELKEIGKVISCIDLEDDVVFADTMF